MANHNSQDCYFLRPKKYNTSNRVKKSTSSSYKKRDNSDEKLVIAKLRRDIKDLKKRIPTKEKALILRNKSYSDSEEQPKDLIDLLAKSADKEIRRDREDLIMKSPTSTLKERVLRVEDSDKVLLLNPYKINKLTNTF